MNRSQFLNSLEITLRNFSPEEKRDILYDYEEHFVMALESGKTEEQISKELGDPRIIGKQYKANYTIEQATVNPSVANTFRALFATLSLGMFNIIFILGPFLAICGVLLAILITSLAVLISGISLIGYSILGIFMSNFILNQIPQSAALFFGIGITALGMLFTIMSGYLTKSFFRITLRYLKLNAKIIVGRG